MRHNRVYSMQIQIVKMMAEVKVVQVMSGQASDFNLPVVCFAVTRFANISGPYSSAFVHAGIALQPRILEMHTYVLSCRILECDQITGV